VTLNPNCYLYSRNPGGTNDLLRIRNDDTSIDQAVIIAGRRLIVQGSADITDSTLYVDYASSSGNNRLQIEDSGTTVTGAVISRGRESPSLRINSGASVTGFLYQYGDASDGRCQINGNSTVTGVVMTRQFHNNSLGPATITHSLASALSYMPQGLNGVVVESGSWDDN